MKQYCFFHSDLDGKSAAWIVHDFISRLGEIDSPVNYQRHNYADPWKLGSLDNSTTAFIVDLSFTESTYDKLLEICSICKEVIWIDHHKSSVDLLEAHPEINEIKNLAIFVNSNACGALLTYTYLTYVTHYLQDFNAPFGKGNITDVLFDYDHPQPAVYVHGQEFVFSIPCWLYIVDDHDRWQKRDQRTDKFVLGIDTVNSSLAYKREDGAIVFNTEFWEPVVRSDIMGYVRKGEIISDYINTKYRKELSRCFEYTLPDGTIILCKNGSGNSNAFQEEINNYAAVVLFSYDGKNNTWYHTVYSSAESTFDCAKFCEQYGGGGHMHAAGFNIDTPVFCPTK